MIWQIATGWTQGAWLCSNTETDGTVQLFVYTMKGFLVDCLCHQTAYLSHMLSTSCNATRFTWCAYRERFTWKGEISASALPDVVMDASVRAAVVSIKDVHLHLFSSYLDMEIIVNLIRYMTGNSIAIALELPQFYTFLSSIIYWSHFGCLVIVNNCSQHYEQLKNLQILWAATLFIL